MKKEYQIENNKLEQLLSMAEFGWWKVDFHTKLCTCSDVIMDLLGLQSNVFPIWDFANYIRQDYKDFIINEFAAIANKETYEQIFPIHTTKGNKWVTSKLGQKEIDENGHIVAWGFIHCISDQDKSEHNNNQYLLNNLLYQQNRISRSLLSFLETDNTNNIIIKTLQDILAQFIGDRVYIFEYDWDTLSQTCIFEVTSKKSSTQQDTLQGIPMKDTPWWTKQLTNYSPILLYNLSELPEEANNEREILERQDIKSVMVVPMTSKDKVWGYLGIDIVNSHRNWTNNDYQWFASLGNFISICMELRKSENKAHQEREYFRNLYEHMLFGYVRMKILRDNSHKPYDFIFQDFNPAFETIIGETTHKFLKQTAKSCGLSPTEINNHLQSFLEIITTGKHLETKYYSPSTDTHCHVTVYSPGSDEIVCLFSDITDTIKAHEALNRSEKQLRNIYKNLPVGIEIYDKNGFLLDMNDKDVEIFEIKDKNVALGVNLFENPNVPEDVKERLRNGKLVDFIIKYNFSHIGDYYETQAKGIKDIIVKATPLYDDNNNLENYLLNIIDNTATSTAYSRIDDFEELFSVIADFAKIGYFKWNPLTQTGFAISQWFKNWGEDENAKLGDVVGIYGHLHPEDAYEMKKDHEELLNGTKNKVRKEVRIRTKDGKWKWMRCHTTVKEFDPANNNIELIGVNLDITEMKENQIKLIEAKNKAETLDKLKSAFLANMSHEIRTPLNAIVGFSNLLINEENIESKTQYISIIQENNELLLQLISDILDLSKMEAGTFDIVYSEVDINSLCYEIVCSMNMKAPESVKVVFENHLPECLIKTDKNRLNQVISNFINNALKFTSQGNICVGYNISGDEIEFYVRDTGIGISKENTERIFDRFVKLNSFIRGTGLGLSICKSIIEQMQGRIGVESEEGSGSRFWFVLPYKPIRQHNPLPDADTSEQVTKTNHTSRPTILVAEDTESNFILISTVLKKEHEIVWAHNGLEAIELYKKHLPNIILMDIKMPEMDGLSATREIRKLDNSIPIIALTAFAYDSDKSKTIEAGCNAYITKPINIPLLKETIKNLIN